MNISDSADLAPLDDLIALLPKIEKAKERARLGTALQKATATVERLDRLPALMRDLLILVEAADADFEEARSEIGYALSAIIKKIVRASCRERVGKYV